MNNKDVNLDETDFSLVLGGPLYQFYLRTRLLKPPLNLVKRRIVAISLFAWLPLLILTLIGGVAFKGVSVPFFFDIETHVKFLGSLALLVAAEVIVHQRIKIIVSQFLKCNIISSKDRSRFDSIVASTIRLRNSITVELLLIVFVFTVGHWIWTQYTSLHVATWYAIPINGNKMQLTLAGYWYAFVSLPIFQLILLRWYFRLFVWYRFLWQISKLPLHLNALHPDQAGGLGFLAQSVFAFAPVLIAYALLLAGFIANRIWYAGATLLEFKLEIAGLVVFLMIVVLLPLTFFIAALVQAKIAGLREYTIVASQYVNDFRGKWIGTYSANPEESQMLLGTPDIQSLSDLSNSFNVVRAMGVVPFSRGALLRLMILILIPFSPLLLTMIPLEEIVGSLIKLLL